MVARGSDRIIDVVEELVAEFPARLRGGQTRLSEHTVGVSPNNKHKFFSIIVLLR